MKKLIPIVSLGLALSLTGFPAAYSADEGEDSKYLEEIIVMGERGVTYSLDRAMTVTGFSAIMIEKLGIQNTNDLEVLVPGMQIGPRSQGGGKNEDGHIVMRGLGNDRSVNFFQDVAVAVYIDGVYSDQSFGLDQGNMWDIERIEIARGPQGTTGGKAAIAGSINFVSRKPTDEFDVRAKAEYTDQFTQNYQIAFGGPIADSNFSYRIAVSSLTGDGKIENIGVGPDAGEPDQLMYAPQLRFKNDRWDVTARYSKLTDKGVQDVSLNLGGRDAENEFTGAINTDPLTGEQFPARNPYFGAGQAPSVAHCSNINLDGSRDPNQVICDGDDLRLKVDLNAPLAMDNSQESATLEAIFDINDNLNLIYKFGWRDTQQDTLNDADQTGRSGGGVCPSYHPRVQTGELTAGETSVFCAMDSGGNGTYVDDITNYLFTSEQTSHELTLISDNDGPFNYTVGLTYIEGDEPYIWRGRVGRGDAGFFNGPHLWEDNTAACEARIEALYGAETGNNRLLRDVYTDPQAMQNAAVQVYACQGSPEILNYPDVTNGLSHANGLGMWGGFYGNVSYESKAVYFNSEYVLNDEWEVFGGIRYNDDTKDHEQNSFSSAANVEGFSVIGLNLRDSSIASTLGSNTADQFPGRTFADAKKGDWNEVTWDIGTEYRPNDDLMVYGRISKGYRPGGFGGLNNGFGEAFDAEEMINYEVGTKGLFLDGTVQLEASVYYQDFSSFWVQSQRRREPNEIRAGESLFIGESEAVDGTHIYGIEVQGAWRISDRFTLRGFYEYADSSFGDFLTLYCCNPAEIDNPTIVIQVEDASGNLVDVLTSNQFNFGGNQLRNQANHKGSLTLTYDVPLNQNMGNLDVVTILSYRGEMFVDEANLDTYKVSDYTRWDLRANWRSPGGQYSVSAWVTNLLDEVAVQSWSPREGTNSPWGTVTDARRIGLSVSYQM